MNVGPCGFFSFFFFFLLQFSELTFNLELKEESDEHLLNVFFNVMHVKQQLALLPASTVDSGQSAFSMALSRALFVFV